jgi:hypothetical protein
VWISTEGEGVASSMGGSVLLLDYPEVVPPLYWLEVGITGLESPGCTKAAPEAASHSAWTPHRPSPRAGRTGQIRLERCP